MSQLKKNALTALLVRQEGQSSACDRQADDVRCPLTQCESTGGEAPGSGGRKGAKEPCPKPSSHRGGDFTRLTQNDGRGPRDRRLLTGERHVMAADNDKLTLTNVKLRQVLTDNTLRKFDVSITVKFPDVVGPLRARYNTE